MCFPIRNKVKISFHCTFPVQSLTILKVINAQKAFLPMFVCKHSSELENITVGKILNIESEVLNSNPNSTA